MQDSTHSHSFYSPNQWLSIRASAGSGKTFSLTARFIYLLFVGARVDEILTLTFTRKAQGEMQERILSTLSDIAREDCLTSSNPYIIELCNLGLSREYLQQHIKNIYTHFLHSNNHIMTFDSFFNMILHKFSFYMGLMSDYEISNNANFADEIFIATLEEMKERKKSDFFAIAQFCYVNNLNTQKIIDMLEGLNIDDLDNLTLTLPTTKANWEEEVVRNYNELKTYILDFIASFDKPFKRIYDAFTMHLDKDSSTNDIFALFDKTSFILSEANKQILQKLGYDEEFCNQKIQCIQAAFEEYFSQREYSVLSLLKKLHTQYNRHKIQILQNKNQLSFNDLNRFCYDLLSKHIDKDFFYFRLDSRINHILVDEFQDTNIRQYLILKPLIDEIKSGVGRIGERSLFFVGDEKQAIYGFRGSDSRLFDAISKVLNMNIISLPKNYRSARHIVEFVNQIFSDKFRHYEMQIPHKTLEGYVKVVTKEKVDDIFEAINERVLQLIAHNRKDIMILTRKNDTAKEIRDYLVQQNPTLNIALGFNSNESSEFLLIFNALKYIQKGGILYLKNCLKLSGKSYFDTFDFKVDSTLEPSAIILEVMKTFGIFGKVAWAILEKAFAYQQLDDFVCDMANMDIEIDEDKKYNVRISNIHKSKGLEFDDVILVEYKGEDKSIGDFYYDYDGLCLKQVKYMKDNRNRSVVDGEFAKVKCKAGEDKMQDLINLLYVAFTRAKESLYIIKPAKSDLFKHINLEDIEIGDDILSQSQTDSKQESHPLPTTITQTAFGRQNDFIQDLPQSYNSLSKIKGIALHLMLEYTLKYKDSASIKHILRNRFGIILNDTHIAEVFKSARKILSNIADILEDSKVRCEVSYLDSTKRIHRIDCLIEKGEKIYILDYKSSDMDLESKKSQISQYKQFISQVYQNKEIVGYLCFANGKITQV